jgi:uncharacterized protein
LSTQTESTQSYVSKIAGELHLLATQVRSTVSLIEEGATVPFIARYRKEATGTLDEVAIESIRDRLAQLKELASRMDAILASLEERDLLTDELKQQVQSAETLAALEDIYLPYRPKRRTRATIAREKGLEPLASLLWQQDDMDVAAQADSSVDPENGVADTGEALQGARDIMAEWVSEDAAARAQIRGLFWTKGAFTSKLSQGKEVEAAKYRDYFDWQEPLSQAPSHRVLAMLRGEKESMLTLHVLPPEEEAVTELEALFVTDSNDCSQQVSMAVQDSYKRLLGPSLETEARNQAKARADEVAIRVFADNLRQLLLASPLGQKSLMAIDPGQRTGCKIAVLDSLGKFIESTTIYLLGERQAAEAAQIVLGLCQRHQPQVIAVGNGTGGRESETFLRGLGLGPGVQIVMVSESGASIYSASQAARDEFPDLDLTVRGAVSIGRRLMDPLAELVKIDPRSIGVGQYQHDVDQGLLQSKLNDVVVSCVNGVGVEVNTASRQLLSYVSGLGPSLAKAIQEYRDANGSFKSRRDLLKVPRLGPKAFEQAAGFLRIRDGDQPLDASAVHPESYKLVQSMAKAQDCSVSDLMTDEDTRSRINLDDYVSDKVGLPTLRDIMAELARPGRDPRQEFEPFAFAEGVETMQDLETGMRLPGLVTNVTAFGAFVDVGVHQDGLVHISQLADRFVRDPGEVVKVNQRVTVTVLEVDLDRKRISLSMKSGPKPQPTKAQTDDGQ